MASLRKRNGSWVLDWREGGKRRREVLGRDGLVSKREAEARLKEKELELYRANGRAAPLVPSFGAFVREYLSWHAAEYPDSHDRIKQIVEQHLVPAFGTLALDTLEPRVVEAWKHGRNGVASATVAKELRTLRAIMTKAVEWEHITFHRLKLVKDPTNVVSNPPLAYTREELARLYAVAIPRHRAYWRFMVNTGLRRNEFLHLAWGDVDDRQVVVRSAAGARTKSARHRTIPLSRGAREALQSLDKIGPRVVPEVWAPSFSRAFARDAAAAQVAGSLHCLRHTFISHLVEQGVPLRTVQSLAGHSTIRITEGYAHVAEDALGRAVRELDL